MKKQNFSECNCCCCPCKQISAKPPTLQARKFEHADLTNFRKVAHRQVDKVIDRYEEEVRNGLPLDVTVLSTAKSEVDGCLDVTLDLKLWTVTPK